MTATAEEFNKPCNKKKCAHVRFSEHKEVHKVLKRCSQISPELKHEIWFDGEDFEHIIEDVEKCVDKMEHGKRLKDKKYCALGLEACTGEGLALKRANREEAWDAVLYEQEHQMKEGRRSSIQIAEAYHSIAQYSEMYAHDLAEAVHEEVEWYLTHDSHRHHHHHSKKKNDDPEEDKEDQ